MVEFSSRSQLLMVTVYEASTAGYCVTTFILDNVVGRSLIIHTLIIFCVILTIKLPE